MKLAFCTSYSEERLSFARAAGFDSLEISVDPSSSLDLDRLTDGDLDRVRDRFQEQGLSVATVSCSPQHLSSDAAERKRVRAYFARALRCCRRLGTDIVATGAAGSHEVPPRLRVALYREVFGEYARIAEGEGVRIAIENCPGHGGYPVVVGNLAFSPELWGALFDAVPSKAIGLEFDPSHLVFLSIDYLRALREFSSRVYAFHAKDTEIDPGGWGRYGCFGSQLMGKGEYRVGTWDFGWWRFRIPGWGDIDWKKVFQALLDGGYDGPVIIEHEDPVFRTERHDEGLRRGLAFLRQFVPGGGAIPREGHDGL